MKKKSLLIPLLILLISAFALKALAIPGFYTSHDGETHTARIANFYLALKEGQIPPRLAPKLFAGLGFPIFIFIYPLPYLIGAILHFLSFSFTQSFELVIALSFAASALTMYFFSRELFGDFGGLLTSLFYSWAPYRFSQIYVRGSIAESFAYLFIPLVLLSLFKLSEKKSKKTVKWIGIGSLSMAGMFLSHQLVSLMFMPVIFAFFVIFLLSVNAKKNYLLQSALIGIAGFASAAFIYLPSLFERQYLQFDNLISYYQDHFVTVQQLIHSPWSYGFSMKGTVQDDMSFQIGLTHLIAVAISAILIFKIKFLDKNKILGNTAHLIAVVSLLIFALSVMLMLENPFTLWFWKSIPLISTVDFPWRWLGVSVFAASMLAGFIVYRNRNIFLYSVLLFFVFYANRNHLRINQTLFRSDDYFLNYQDTATWQNEFLPKWRKTNKWQNVEKDFFTPDKETKVKIRGSKTNQLDLSVESETGGTLLIHRLYFPGWRVFMDGKQLVEAKDFSISQNIQLETENLPFVDRSGFIEVTIPSGKHSIKAVFTETLLRKMGFFISALGIILAIALTIKGNLNGNLLKLLRFLKTPE